MKFCKIQDTLNRCSSFLDVACIALDNEHFFPEGNTVSLLLEDVNNRINSCIEELEKMKGTEYYGAAEPPVRCGESHLSGLMEPPHFIY